MVFDSLFCTTTSHMVCSKTYKNINVVFFTQAKVSSFICFLLALFVGFKAFNIMVIIVDITLVIGMFN